MDASPTQAARPFVCGFSFGRNLTRLAYPVEAAVRSVLPVCDRFVFAVGKSDDDTRQRVERIDTAEMNRGRGGAIDIVETEWPDVQVDGTVLSIEANKAMAAAERIAAEAAQGRPAWGFYIQADEVIHEDDLPIVEAAISHWAEHEPTKALLFWYHHFVLDYETTDPWMYHKASRVVRLDGGSRIFGDACGPGFKDPPPDVLKFNDGYFDKRLLGKHVRWAKDPAKKIRGGKPARVFHYGWVKTRDQLDAKFEMVDKLWWGTLPPEEKAKRKHSKFGRFIDRYPILKKFHGRHPKYMTDRIAAHPPYAKVPSRWLNPRFYTEVLRHGFHG